MDPGPSAQVTASDPGSAHRADWYPDPTGRFEYRYHNGQNWTGDVSVDGSRFLDPPATWVPAGGGGHRDPAEIGSGKARAAFVLGLCAFLIGWVPFLCVVAIAAAITGLVLGIGALRRDSRSRSNGGQNGRAHGYAIAGVVLAPLALAVSVLGVWLSVAAVREVQTFAEVGKYTTTDISCGVTKGVVTYVGTIHNDDTATHSYEVTVEFLRPGTSVRRYIASASVVDVGPGESSAVTVHHSASDAELTCHVFDVTGPLPFGGN